MPSSDADAEGELANRRHVRPEEIPSNGRGSPFEEPDLQATSAAPPLAKPLLNRASVGRPFADG